MVVLRQVNRELGQTIILVTHDTAVAACVDRTLAIRDGRTSTETIRRSPVQPLESQAVQPMMPASARSTFASAVPVVPAALDQLNLALAQAGLENRLELHVLRAHLRLRRSGTRLTAF